MSNTGTYAVPDAYNPHHCNLFLQHFTYNFNLLSPPNLSSSLLISAISAKLIYAFLSVQCVLHAVPTYLVSFTSLIFIDEYKLWRYQIWISSGLLQPPYFGTSTSFCTILSKTICNFPLNSVSLFMQVIVYMETFILNSSQNFWDKCIISETSAIQGCW
jgi:hypothetical protein